MCRTNPVQTKLENLRFMDICRLPAVPTNTNPRPYRKYRVTWIPVSPDSSGVMIELRQETRQPGEARYTECRPDTLVEWLASDQDRWC